MKKKTNAQLKKCKNCNIDIIAKNSAKKFCTQKCADAFRYIPEEKKGKIIKCQQCGIGKYFQKSRADNRKYCRKKCADKAQETGKEYNCTICNKVYYRNNGQIKHRGESLYCTKKCKGEAMKIMIKKQMPKKRKEGGVKLKKKLWIVFSKYIKKRDNNICFTCGVFTEGYNCHSGHFIPKSVGGLSLYFHEDNVHCQCMRCNVHLGGNQWEYGQRLGKKKVNELMKLKGEYRKITDQEYIDLIEKYSK